MRAKHSDKSIQQMEQRILFLVLWSRAQEDRHVYPRSKRLLKDCFRVINPPPLNTDGLSGIDSFGIVGENALFINLLRYHVEIGVKDEMRPFDGNLLVLFFFFFL